MGQKTTQNDPFLTPFFHPLATYDAEIPLGSPLKDRKSISSGYQKVVKMVKNGGLKKVVHIRAEPGRCQKMTSLSNLLIRSEKNPKKTCFFWCFFTKSQKFDIPHPVLYGDAKVHFFFRTHVFPKNGPPVW